MLFPTHTHKSSSHISTGITYKRKRDGVCFALGRLIALSTVFLWESLLSVQRTVSQNKNDDRVFTLSIDVMCVCVSYFCSNHTADHMLEISMFCFLLESVWHFSLSVSHSPDDIGTCWFILLSGSVFIKESMFLPRSRYVPYPNAIKYQTFTVEIRKHPPNTLSINLLCILSLYLSSFSKSYHDWFGIWTWFGTDLEM